MGQVKNNKLSRLATDRFPTILRYRQILYKCTCVTDNYTVG